MSVKALPEEYVLRQAGPDDLIALIGVQQACDGAPQWRAAVWSRLLLQPEASRSVWVAETADVPAGFAVAAAATDAAELESVAVLASHRGRGLGRVLCLRCAEWARSRGAASMQLEVRASNTNALRLYRELGYVEQGRRRGYYREPVEEALLLSLTLP